MPVVSEGNVVLPIPARLPCNSVCAFSKEGNNRLESEQRSNSATKLSVLMIFNLIIMVVEIVGGVKANSLAVMTDATHLLADFAANSIALFTVWASGWKATPHQSFGYNRLEVLGTLLSLQLIWLISGIIIYEAVERLLHNNGEVNGLLMFATAAFGLVTNFIMVKWLGHDHSHSHSHHHACHDKDHDHESVELCAVTEDEETHLVSDSPEKNKILNIILQGAYLHVMADLIQSAGVMIAGAIIWAKPDWLVVDLICTLLFSVLVICTTLTTLRDIFGILMERVPGEIDIARLEDSIKCIKGVQDIHDLHVWAITVGKIVLSCHVIAEPGVSSSEIVYQIRDYCERTHEIHHVTIQIE